ncbi:MAG: hypothetical protein AAB788_01820 [Patescibacteria group bacterium]
MTGPEGGGTDVVATELQEIFVFYAGKYPIYPKDGYPGAPTSDFNAVRIEGKIQGLNAYQSITPIHLFHRDKAGQEHYWQRSVSTKFGAYSMKAHRKKQ